MKLDHARMLKLAARFEKWKPAAAVLKEVSSIRTIFPQVDHVSKVNGWPIERFSLVHGPSNHGKTEMVLGLGASFLKQNHFFCHIDAECTTPMTWVRQLMGAEAEHPWFMALRPTSYEECVDSVREFCEKVATLREEEEIPPDTTGLVVVDSVRKLVPKKLLDKLMKEGSDGEGGKGGRRGAPAGVDGMGGRAAQIKAAMNAAWLDELVQLLSHTRTAMVAITRETELQTNHPWEKSFKTGGGAAMFYDASLVARVGRDAFVRDGDILYGERHSVEIHKTKVAGKDEKLPMAYYHTSNGNLDGTPNGFDVARDLIELGLEVGVLEQSGAWVVHGKNKIGNGVNAAVRKLYAEPEKLAALEEEVRAKSESKMKGGSDV